jgi:hypothetical protein
MAVDSVAATRAYWLVRECAAALDLERARRPLEQLAWPPGHEAATMLRSGLALLVLEREEPARRLLGRAAEAAALALGRASPPPPAGAGAGPAGRAEVLAQLAAARAIESLQLARWLLGGGWDAAAWGQAAALATAARGGRLGGLDPPWQVLLWLSAEQPATAAALARADGARRGRQLQAAWLVAGHLAGDAALAGGAGAACRHWVRQAARWHRVRDDFGDSERLMWLRLWGAYYGGPSDAAQALRAVRGF